VSSYFFSILQIIKKNLFLFQFYFAYIFINFAIPLTIASFILNYVFDKSHKL